MTTSLSLYKIEEHLAALLETQDAVPAEQEEEHRAELARYLTAAADKRDAVSAFLSHCDGHIEMIDREIDRLTQLKKHYQRAAERLREYTVWVIQSLGKDERGRWRKLEGNTCVLTIRACPPSVEVTNEEAVPSRFKTITVSVPADAWESLIDSVDIDERTSFLAAVRRADVAVDKRAVKEAIERGERVPGVTLRQEKYSLAVR